MKFRNHPLSRPASGRDRVVVLASVCLATLLSANAQAAQFNIPVAPLETGAQYPSPNVMFVLDDSGSMARDYMPDTVPNDDFNRKLYTNNSLFYNPANTYRPWIKADGTRFTGGTSFSGVYDSDNLASGSTTSLVNQTQTYYVPKAGFTEPSDWDEVWRYDIIENDAAVSTVRGRIVRSEYIPPETNDTVPTGYPKLISDTNTTGTMRNLNTFNVPTGVTQLLVTLSGGTHGSNGPGYTNGSGQGSNLYLRFNAAPTTGTNTCESEGNGNNESCTINNPAAGTWHIGVVNDSRYRDVSLQVVLRIIDPLTGVAGAGCSTALSGSAWRNCTFATPTGRTEANEKTNYATWYSYARTRMKLAKSGASEAFAALGPNFRVGFNTIWNDSSDRFPIPVGTSEGAFANSDGTANANRTTWFNRLHGVVEDGGTTPLLPALQRTGEYFEETASTGPWGPGNPEDQLSCRQSFAILTTDGYWNNTTGYSSTTIGDAGDPDNVSGPVHTSSKGATLGYTVARPYCDNRNTGNCSGTTANTLADVAMSYWKNDLRSDLANDVASSTSDPAFWQHMVTFGISIGLQGTLDPVSDLASLKNGSKGWPNPTDTEDDQRIDDLFHAAVNGRGMFVSASNPQEFQRGLQEAFAIVQQRQGSASNVTANSTSFSNDTLLFQASYVTGAWRGELSAFDASSEGLSQDPVWVASEQLPVWGSRKFFTWNGTAGATFPTAAQLTALDQSARLNGPATGTENANYIKGDQSKERQNDDGLGAIEDLRDRAGLLGDIVNSSPTYARDTDVLYVGANDGMMHAFDATTGVELFNYLPGGMNYTRLGSLSDPFYSHAYFVDGPISVSSFQQTPGKNYLVGALGRGGKTVFGLDVTTPETFAASNVLWERTDATDMGLVMGEPLIAELQDGTEVVMIGNGINSTNESAVLFVYNIASGALVQKIDTGETGENGLFAPRGADLNLDGKVDYVYAGDMKGNVWKFDFTGASGTVAFSGEPFFTGPTHQHITSGLALARDPATNKVWVFFGTGRFMLSTDPADNSVQAIYGLIDEGTTTITRSDLKNREIASIVTQNGQRLRAFEPTGALAVDVRGWFVDLDEPTPGERVVTRPQVVGTALFFVSRVPPADNTCDASGTGFINALSAFTGATTDQPFFDINGDGLFNEDDMIGANGGTDNNAGGANSGTQIAVGSKEIDSMPTGGVFVDEDVFYGTSDAETGNEDINALTAQERRASWREVTDESALDQ